MLTRLPLSLVALLALAPLAGCDDKQPHTANDLQGAGEDTDTDSDSDTDGEPEPEPAPWPDEAVPCAGVEPRECRLDGDKAGFSHCIVVDDEQVWTPCQSEWDACTPGDSHDMGCIGAYCAWNGSELEWFDWQTDPDCATPLVLSFDAAPIRFEASASAPAFDFASDNTCATDWPSVPWLALDRDHDGRIDSGRELFGSGTRLASGRRAAHGFEALAELDADGDGRITPADPRFAELVLWGDHDDDRAGELAELVPAGARGLIAIHLDFQRRGECDERGNCGLERAAFEYHDVTGQPRVGEIVDVYLACQ